MTPEVTALVAVYGAVLATLGAIWNFIRDRKDRARRLRVNAFLRSYEAGHYVVVKVTNVGGVPAVPTATVVTNGRGENQELHWLRDDGPFSRLLQPGESSGQASSDLFRLVDSDLRIYVEDSLGKKWCVKRAETRRLAERVRESLKKGQRT